MNTKKNSGYQKTHQLIQQAYLSLLNCFDYKDITVSAVCIQAHINRSTFYAHYADVYELIETIGDTYKQELTSLHLSYSINNNPLSLSDKDYTMNYLLIILEYWYNNKAFFQILKDRKAYEGLMKTYKNEFNILFYKGLDTASRETNYYFNFFVDGFGAIIRQWLQDGCVESPQQLADIISRLVPDSTWELFAKRLKKTD